MSLLPVLIHKNKTDAMPCERFVFVGASRLRVEPPVADLKSPKNEGEGWLLLAARGWRVFLLFLHGYHLKSKYYSHAYKNHDSPEAGGDQQASLTWAAGGLQMAERNVAGMKRKVLSAAKPYSVMQAK